MMVVVWVGGGVGWWWWLVVGGRVMVVGGVEIKNIVRLYPKLNNTILRIFDMMSLKVVNNSSVNKNPCYPVNKQHSQ